MAGCLYCGTGTGCCPTHTQQIKEAVAREGGRPRTQTELERGGGRR